MDFGWHRLATALVCCMLLLCGSGYSQYKRIYLPDTATLQIPNVFKAVKLVETDLPGKELAILGSLSSVDSGGTYRSEMYNLLTNLAGEPQRMNFLEDTSVFAFQSPSTYGGCYDGDGIFYLAAAANGKQVVIKTDASGQMLWAKAGHHHEYYSMLCEGGSVTFMGQDESIQGAHDFSLAQLDASGGGGFGTMFGTPQFEVPQKLAKIGGEYLMVGSSFQTSVFDGLVVKADTGLAQVWGKLVHIPGKSVLFMGIDRPLDGNGYIMSGRLRGAADSLFLMKMDIAGNPVWTKVYGITGTNECYNTALAVDPQSGGYLLSGYYRGTVYSRPMIMMTDSTGELLWARDYGDPGVNTDETINDIIYCQADGMFCGVGDVVEVDSNQFLHKILMIKVAANSGSIPCDSAIAIGVRSVDAQLGGSTVEEPFLANFHFPIGNLFGTTCGVSTRCEVIAGRRDGAAATGIFQVVNPSGSLLQVRAEVPEGGAYLRVTTLTGTVVHAQQLEAGMQQLQIPMPQLASGLYLVSLAGEEWRYPTLRWVVQR